MKNDIFNFRRFGKYFASDFRTCLANYGLSLITISILFQLALYAVSVGMNILLDHQWDGPDMGLRTFVCGIAMLCITVTMPVKCYGRLTEKQYGSFWLTLPASRLEKFISMILLTCIITPLAGGILFLGVDSIICALDPTCGKSLMAGFCELVRNMGELTGEIDQIRLNLGIGVHVEAGAEGSDIMKQVSSPWLYVDEIFGITLPFLLGAIYFKSGKTVKTFLCIAAFSMLTSAIMGPFITKYSLELLNNAANEEAIISEMLNSGIFKHLAVIDTITDTVVNLALFTGIWFRIKNLKH